MARQSTHREPRLRTRRAPIFRLLPCFAVPLLLSAGVLAASLPQSPEETVSTGTKWFPGAAILAVLLAVLHLRAPTVRRVLHEKRAIIGAFARGMAIAYVFVHLLPELDKGHAVLGRMIFAVALVSFLVYYGVDSWLQRRTRQTAAGAAPNTFVPKLVFLWIYNWLIVYGAPEQAAESGWHSIPLILALVAHLVDGDYSLGDEFTAQFDSIGRYALALAPIVAWGAVVLDQKTDSTTNDIFVALLAGTLLFNIFKEELPERGEARFHWFLLGAFLFAAFAALSVPA